MTSALLGGIASTAVVGVVGISLIDRMNPQQKNHFSTVLSELRRGNKTVETISRKTGVPTGRVTTTLRKATKAGWVHVTNKSAGTWRYSLTSKGRSALKAL